MDELEPLTLDPVFATDEEVVSGHDEFDDLVEGCD